MSATTIARDRRASRRIRRFVAVEAATAAATPVTTPGATPATTAAAARAGEAAGRACAVGNTVAARRRSTDSVPFESKGQDVSGMLRRGGRSSLMGWCTSAALRSLTGPGGRSGPGVLPVPLRDGYNRASTRLRAGANPHACLEDVPERAVSRPSALRRASRPWWARRIPSRGAGARRGRGLALRAGYRRVRCE